ncbi:MAG: RNA polymerase sigma factor [Pseudonocardiaceae bacterium]
MVDIDVGSAQPQDETDALLARLADNLDAGFVDLVRTYQRVLYSVAVQCCGRSFDAEDLAAEALLRAYIALRGYDRQRILALRPRAWLLTILLNTWRNWARDSSRRPHQVPLSDHVDQSGGETSTEELAERHETLQELNGMVRLLPDAQRDAVVLRHVVGLPIAEVATLLGCPQGTAKSHVSRGLRQLRAHYQAPRHTDAATVTRRDGPTSASITGSPAGVVPRSAQR